MKLFAPLATALALSTLVGCSSDFVSAPGLIPTPGVALSGRVHGGNQLLSGSHIYLYAVSNVGYGTPSVSLLRTTASGVLTDTNGSGYVVADAGGGFNITGDWSCVNASDQIYIAALGGNPGLPGNVNNAAIAMVNGIGACSTISASTFVVINELSTVAAATALAQFSVDASHIGTSATNPSGVANAFLTIANMVDLTDSNASRVRTVGGNGAVPQATLDSLANILSSCVNSSSGTSTACSTLFTATTPSGGSAPNNTFNAVVNIALHPTANVSALFGLSPASPPFAPALASAPSDWTVGISYTLGSGSALPAFIALDAAGNVWVSSSPSQNFSIFTDTIIKLAPNGQVLSGTGFTDGGLVNLPQGLAIDDTGAVYVANTSNTILKLNNDGTNATGFPFTGANYPRDIALDTQGNAWVTNFGVNGGGVTIFEISSTGASLNSGVTGSNFSGGQGIAIDQSGNIWAVGQSSNNIFEIGPNAAVKSGSTGFNGGGLFVPAGDAFDASGRLWVINSQNGGGMPEFSVFNNNGTAASPSTGYTAPIFGYANILAMDGASTAWTASCGSLCGNSGSDAVVHMGPTGNFLNSPGFSNPTLSAPQAVAIDASGNLWVGNAGNATVTQFVGSAVPVKTPLQSALKANLLGARP